MSETLEQVAEDAVNVGMGKSNTYSKENVDRFFSLMLDGVRPLPQIQERMWDYIHKTMCEDEKESDMYERLATELGWVMGLSDDEMDTLILAECIKSSVLEPALESYNKKMQKRYEEASENIEKRKAETQ